MKIREKLSISFSVVASIMLMVFGVAIYFFFDQYRKNEFDNRLKQRIDVTEKMFLERENFSEQAFNTIQEQFLNKLPEETEEVVELTDVFREQISQDYPESFLKDLILKGESFFSKSDRQGAGKVFHVHGKDYLVLLTAIDYIGIGLMDHLLTILFIGLAVCILAMIIVSHRVSGNILNPILQKIRKANSISANNMHERLTVSNPDDELGELAIAFNHLLDRVAAAFEAQRSFIDSASHEIRNPLTTIIGEAEYALERTRSNEQYIASLKVISEEADRLNNLVNSLLKLSGISSKQSNFLMEVVGIKNILISCLEKLTYINPAYQIEFDNDRNTDFEIRGNPHLLETSFINLIDNGCKFSFNKPVKVSLTQKSTGTVTIVIEDKGIGILPEELSKVTQPFHRAQNARKIAGVGIGIPLTSKIVELHKGSLEFHSTINVGTTVSVTLPLAGGDQF
ncbi:MAG TPA: ATP-binding protein [Cyclobacteriaceae bacterium]